MARQKSDVLVEPTKETVAIPRQHVSCLPLIPPETQLKWGLALLGEEKAMEYLKWLRLRLEQTVL